LRTEARSGKRNAAANTSREFASSAATFLSLPYECLGKNCGCLGGREKKKKRKKRKEEESAESLCLLDVRSLPLESPALGIATTKRHGIHLTSIENNITTGHSNRWSIGVFSDHRPLVDEQSKKKKKKKKREREILTEISRPHDICHRRIDIG